MKLKRYGVGTALRDGRYPADPIYWFFTLKAAERERERLKVWGYHTWIVKR